MQAQEKVRERDVVSAPPTLHFFRGGVEASGGVALCGYRYRGLTAGIWVERLGRPSDCPVCDDLRGLR